MPLSKKKDRERKRKSNPTRLESSVNSNLIQPNITMGTEPMPWDGAIDTSKYAKSCVKMETTTYLVQPKVLIKPTIDEFNEGYALFGKPDVVQPSLHRYNPAIHKPGDRVLIQRGKKWLPYMVPEVDGGGQTVPEWY